LEYFEEHQKNLEKLALLKIQQNILKVENKKPTWKNFKYKAIRRNSIE